MGRTIAGATSAVCVAMALVHLYQVNLYVFESGYFNAIHLTLALAVVFLAALDSARHNVPAFSLYLLCLIVAVACFIYISVEYQELVFERSYFPNTPDLFVALALLAVTFMAVLRDWGWGIPVAVALVLLYGYSGNLFPDGILYHGGIPLPRLVGLTSIPYFDGLLGSLASISATTLFLFLLFAGMLKANGGVDFIVGVSARLFGATRAGPAQVAVFGSSLMSMISGSSVANVASTGTITIPAMKRHGYSPAFSGAVEATASNGGQIMPPVMGLAAFVMIGMTGFSYTQIAAAAIAPGLIYYAYLMLAVHLYAVRNGIVPAIGSGEEGGVLRLVLLNLPTLVGIVILLTALFRQLPPSTAVSLSIAALAAGELVKQFVAGTGSLGARTRHFLKVILNGLKGGALNGARVGVVMCLIGVLVEIFVVTGLGQKLANHVVTLGQDNLIAILALVALSCLVLGCGLPTTAAYVMVVLLSAPALVEIGVPLLAAHLFVFYFANVSALTPPIAIGALVAANIADAPFLQTSLTAVRLALPAFVLPFLFVVEPAILGIGTDLMGHMAAAFRALAALALVTIALEGAFVDRLSPPVRLLVGAAGLAMLHPGIWSTIVGVAAAVVVGGWQIRGKRFLAKGTEVE